MTSSFFLSKLTFFSILFYNTFQGGDHMMQIKMHSLGTTHTTSVLS